MPSPAALAQSHLTRPIPAIHAAITAMTTAVLESRQVRQGPRRLARNEPAGLRLFLHLLAWLVGVVGWHGFTRRETQRKALTFFRISSLDSDRLVENAASMRVGMPRVRPTIMTSMNMIFDTPFTCALNAMPARSGSSTVTPRVRPTLPKHDTISNSALNG